MTSTSTGSIDDGRQFLNDTLRMFVGQGKRFSWADMAAATEEKERTLRSYVEAGGPCMPFPIVMRVFAVLPPEAWGRVCARMGFAAPAPLEVDDGATVRRAVSAAARLVADGTEFLEDGILSPRERAILADEAESLVPQLQVIIGGRPA